MPRHEKRAQPCADVIEAASAGLSLTQSKAKAKARKHDPRQHLQHPLRTHAGLPSNGFGRYTYTTTRPAQVLASGVHYWPFVRTAYLTALLD